MSLPRSKFHMPLTAGLNTKADPRALPAPELAVAQNVEFDQLGGLHKRKPFVTMSLDHQQAAQPDVTDLRKIVANGDELCLFSKDKLWSWSESEQGWVDKGEHMAVHVEETPVFVRTEEQTHCDRAEMSGIIVYTWQQQQGSAVEVFVAAIDGATGAVIVPPQGRGASTKNPRLLALSTRILLFHESSTGALEALSIDPADLFASMTGSGVVIAVAASYNGRYDVCRSNQTLTNALVCYRKDTTTSYDVGRVPEGVTGFVFFSKARSSTNAMAIASSPSGNRMMVVRNASDNTIRADLIVENSVNDQTVDMSLGSEGGVPDYLSAGYAPLAVGGQFRCHVLWNFHTATTNADFDLMYNHVDNGGATGTSSIFVRSMVPATQVFGHGDHAYVWLAFGQESSIADGELRSALQSTYFLYRPADGALVSKAVMHRGGGHGGAGRMASVQSLGNNRFAWAGNERRVIRLGKQILGYSAHEPVDVIFEFDSNLARRCVRLGQTVYVSGGMVMQYDGEALTEVGFNVYPYRLATAGTGAGSGLVAGDYAVKNTWRWDNAKGERERSTTATIEKVTLTAGQKLRVSINCLDPTRKQGTRSPVIAEMWRSKVNPTPDADHYLTTSQDPMQTTGDNRYAVNIPKSLIPVIDDAFSDVTLLTKEANPENGGVLENLVPTGGTIITASQDRLFLAGIPNNPYQVRYSKLRGANEVAAFHDALTFEVPPDGGIITALHVFANTLIVFCERAIWAMPGTGFDNLGTGQNYGPAQPLALDVGAVSHEAVVFTPAGVVFKSEKGWYTLPGAAAPQYIGDKVAGFDGDTVVGIHTMDNQHQVRILTGARMLVWDYYTRQWSEWTSNVMVSGRASTVWQGQHVVIVNSALYQQGTDFTVNNESYSLDVETAWIKDGLQDFQRIYNIYILGEYRSAHRVWVRLARDYQSGGIEPVTVFFDDRVWTPNPQVVGGPLQVRVPPSVQKCQSMKIRITDRDATLDQPAAGEALHLTGIGFEVGLKQGMFKLGSSQVQG